MSLRITTYHGGLYAPLVKKGGRPPSPPALGADPSRLSPLLPPIVCPVRTIYAARRVVPLGVEEWGGGVSSAFR